MTAFRARRVAFAALFAACLAGEGQSATVALSEIRWETYSSYLRCVISTERPIQINQRDLIAERGLFYVDLYNVHGKILSPLKKHGDAYLESHEFKAYPSNVLRLILKTRPGVSYRVTTTESPARIVIDLFGGQGAGLATPAAVRTTPRMTAPTRQPAPPTRSPGPTLAPAAQRTARPTRKPITPPPTPAPTTSPPRPEPTMPPPPPPTPNIATRTPPPTRTPRPPAPTGPPASPPTSDVQPVRRTVIIDPGHGGEKQPTRGTFRRGGRTVTVVEKDLVLQLALKLAGMIQKAGNMDFHLTRQSDKYITLAYRVEVAERIAKQVSGPCVFVSIHGNDARNSSARGVEIYYLDEDQTRNTANREIERLENTEEFREDFKDHPILKRIYQEMGNAKLVEHKEDSKLLCANIDYAFRLAPYWKGRANNRGVKSANFFVLKNFLMPAVLFEAGFLSNKEECELLSNDDFQYNIAASLFNGINCYFKYQDQSFQDTYYECRPHPAL